MQTVERRRPGRPGRDPRPGERVGLSLRVTPETKLSLDVAAAASGRSLSQEAEFRLEQSFRSPGFLREILETAFGPVVAQLMMLFGRQMRRTTGYRNVPFDSNWLSDPDAFEYARASVQVALDWLRPEGEALPETSSIAKNHAEMMMRDITDAPAPPAGDPRSWLREMREGLGPEPLARGEARRDAFRHPARQSTSHEGNQS